MKVFFIVKGPLIWLDEKGEPDGYFDVHHYIALCKAHYDKVGLGAAPDRSSSTVERCEPSCFTTRNPHVERLQSVFT